MIEDLFSLKDNVALVTGSLRGLGRAMARALAGAGAHVVLNGRDQASLDSTAGALTDEGLKVSKAPFDVSDEASASSAISEIVADHGRLDILINNAGTATEIPLAESDTLDWHRIIDTDLTACFYLSREAVKPMLVQGGGRIINITSIMSYVARPSYASYVAAKHALAGLTKSLAVEYGRFGINSNAIAPGYFATDIMIELDLVSNPEFNGKVCARTPLGRWGQPDELGGVAVFLASKASSYVNGAILTVDGGMTASLFPDYPEEPA